MLLNKFVAFNLFQNERLRRIKSINRGMKIENQADDGSARVEM